MDSLHMLCSSQQAKELVLKAVNENGIAAHAKSELWKELERVNVHLGDVESFARKAFSKTGSHNNCKTYMQFLTYVATLMISFIDNRHGNVSQYTGLIVQLNNAVYRELMK